MTLSSIPSGMPTPTTSAPILVTAITVASYGTYPESWGTYLATGVSGNTLTGLTLIDGTDSAWAAGAYVEMRNCAYLSNLITTALTSLLGLSGLIKVVSGVPGAAVSGTDYVVPSVTSLSSLATVGTITSGTWKSTLATTHQASANLNATALPAPQTGTVLQIANADTTPTRLEIDSFGATSYLSLMRSDGTNASPSALQSGDEIGGFNVWGHDGVGVVGPRASVRCYAGAIWSSGSQPTYISLTTTAVNTVAQVEVMRLGSDQSVTLPATVTGGSQGAGTLNAAGLYVNGSSVLTSFTGDGTVLSSTPSTTGVASLALAPGNTILGNATTSNASPTYAFGLFGVPQVLTATSTTLSASSPSYNILNAASNAVNVILPASSTCPGKVFYFSSSSGAHAQNFTLNAADTYLNNSAGSTIALQGNTGAASSWPFAIMSSGVSSWLPMFPFSVPTTQIALANNGALCYVASSALTTMATGTSGQLPQSGGSGAPTWTSTPGSGTALTSVTANAFNASTGQTTVSGTSGNYKWSQPFAGASYKQVIIYLNAYTNSSTSAIVFTTAFTQTPVVSADSTTLTISTISNTGITIPIATSQSGFIILEGY